MIQNELKHHKTKDFVQNDRYLVTKRKVVMNAKSFRFISVYKKRQKDRINPPCIKISGCCFIYPRTIVI